MVKCKGRVAMLEEELKSKIKVQCLMLLVTNKKWMVVTMPFLKW